MDPRDHRTDRRTEEPDSPPRAADGRDGAIDVGDSSSAHGPGDELAEAVHFDPGSPYRDQPWNLRARNETPTERLDRNWTSLLQEVRVLQMSVQLLSGYLLVLPFQPRFATLSTPCRVLYYLTMTASLAAVIVFLTPIALHRMLFRTHNLSVVVTATHRLVLLGTCAVGLALTGAAALVVAVGSASMLTGATAAIAGGACAGFFWWWLPRHLFRRYGHDPGAPAER
ncbi:hypothetical protein HWD35_11250 [Tsukamurella tyrosinosolvens]|uniref:DUF6328 family protein n=1 Tax=Tsukamurella tyrosinosolvens TaxID=57704 RepID=UPI0011470B18|nr:DUF6328 family protein [Tsukamurella tyrosinosolvens]MCA4995287.1 hypothetical protein [Tsukamurella tyrosinosolvens]